MVLPTLDSVDSVRSILEEHIEKEQTLATMRPRKRSVRIRSPFLKLEALERIQNGEIMAAVARDLDVPESTLRGWIKAEDKIREAVRKLSTSDSNNDSPTFSSDIIMRNLAGASNVSSEDAGMPVMTQYINTMNNTALLMQRHNLLSNTQNINNSLLSLSTASGLASSHLGWGHHDIASTSSPVVGFVENGLHYKTTSSGSMKRSLSSSAGSSNSHTFAIAPSQHAVTMTNNQCSDSGNMQLQAEMARSKVKAQLDQALYKNNNIEYEQMIVDLSASAASANRMSEDEAKEAIEHGQAFCDWLEKCSEPTVTRFQIMQIKKLLQNLNDKKKPNSPYTGA